MSVLLAVGLVVLPVPAPAATLSAEVAGIRVELESEPDPPDARHATTYRVRLTAADGTPASGARVTLQGRMVDGMTVVAPLAPANEPGLYRGRILFTMEGAWTLTLRVVGRGQRFEVPLDERVGR